MRVSCPIYTAEFKSNAVELLRTTDRSVQAAKDLGVSYWSLREWYRKAEMRRGRNRVSLPRPVVIPGTCLLCAPFPETWSCAFTIGDADRGRVRTS